MRTEPRPSQAVETREPKERPTLKGVGSSDWFGKERTSAMIIGGTVFQSDVSGGLIERPALLSEQLDRVKASLGAEPLKERLHVTFESYGA